MLSTHTKAQGWWAASARAWKKSSVQKDNNGGAYASRVLLVDDERDLVELLAFLVEQAGFIPIRAVDPAQALGILARALLPRDRQCHVRDDRSVQHIAQ